MLESFRSFYNLFTIVFQTVKPLNISFLAYNINNLSKFFCSYHYKALIFINIKAFDEDNHLLNNLFMTFCYIL